MAAGRQRSQRQLKMKGSTESGATLSPEILDTLCKKISFQFLYQPQNQQGCRDFKTDILETPSHRVIRMIWQMSDKNDLLLQ